MMLNAFKLINNTQFADRLRLALKGVGSRSSATVSANEFHLHFQGESIAVNTARN